METREQSPESENSKALNCQILDTPNNPIVSRRTFLKRVGATLFAGLLTNVNFRSASAEPVSQEVTEEISGIRITGSSEFRNTTKKALAVLGSTRYYNQIQDYVRDINEGPFSGMFVLQGEKRFQVGRATWNADTIWYAGSILHDSNHSKLYYETKEMLGGKEPDNNVWTGDEAERKCMLVQLSFLKDVKAPEYMIKYLEKYLIDPNYDRIPVEQRNY